VENPVFRHSRRLVGTRLWPVTLLAVLFGALSRGLLIERYWMELPEYSLLAPPRASRTLAGALLGAAVVLPTWAALRAAGLWRRLIHDGHLDEYRRSRLSPHGIVLGAWLAALSPTLLTLAASLAGCAALALSGRLRLGEVLGAHTVLVALTAAAGALGLWLAGRLAHPGMAGPLALGLLAVCVGALPALDPFLPRLRDPSPWIYAALLPNPLTAVGNALNMDVLRFGWLYERLRTPEYFYLYPPVWQTALCYLAAAAGWLLGAARRLA
jgi:hypothetical protein